MIYRIFHDLNYARCLLDPLTILAEFGGEMEYTFTHNPKEFLPTWKEVEVRFFSDSKKIKSKIPDVSEDNSRVFLSEKAYVALYDLISDYGEFLPVYHDTGKGYMFNPLFDAESVGASDKGLLIYDLNHNLDSVSFIEEKLKGIPIFKSEVTGWTPVYCNEDFIRVCNEEGLTGGLFSENLVHPFGDICHKLNG